MMKLIGVLFVCVMMTGCVSGSGTTYAEVGMGYNDNWFGGKEWENGGSGPMGATFEIGREWDVKNNPHLKAKCRYMHVSHWTVGPPWNDDEESSLDHVGCAARYEF